MDAQRKRRRIGRVRPAALLPAIAPIAAVGVAVTFFMSSGAGAADGPSPTGSPTAEAQVANATFEHALPGRPRSAPSTTAVVGSPTPTGSEPPVQAPESCRVTHEVVNSWGQGFQANVTLHNTETAPLQDWRLTWRSPDGVRITSAWNGVLRVDGTDVTVTSASWNATVAPGATVTIGYTAATDTTIASPDTPAEFHLDGTACLLA